MKPLTCSIEIASPVEHVFGVASDIPGAAERVEGIKSVEMLSEGPVGEGTRWRETRIMFGREAKEEMWITAFDPPNAYRVEARSHGTRYDTRFEFEPTEAGTRLTMRFQGTPETLSARVLGTLFSAMTKHLEKCIRDDLVDIKAACESG
ncbi:MAG: SRPBCC family protein [Planctomycetota bacterium]